MKIEDLSKVKSSTGIVKLFSDELLNSVMNAQNEEIARSPASFVSLLLSGIGDLAANSFFEQAQIKRELHKNTAILPKSLFRYLSDTELPGVFGKPASSTFFLAIPYNILMKNAVIDPSLGAANIKKARINKDSSITLLGRAVFILDHSINITILNSESAEPTINVAYDLSDKYSSSISNIVNPYITNKIFNYNGIKYVGFEITARCYERKEHVFSLDLDTIKDKYIYYSDNLMGFEVLYRTSSTGKYTLLTGYPDGVDPVNGYNYSLGTKKDLNYIRINFGSSDTSFVPGSRSALRVIVYTTVGESGNLNFPDLNADLESNIQLIFRPDSTNPFEQALSTATPLITSRSTASTGGRSAMSFEEIRSYVINKSSDNKTLTPADLQNRAAEYDMTVEKTRHDIALIYRLNSSLADAGSNLLSSGSGVLRFNFDDVPLKTTIAARMLKPSFVYKYDEGDQQYKYLVNKSPLTEYVKEYRNNRNAEVCFPFFIKTLFSDVVSAKIYNMAFDDIYYTEIEYYDSYALDTVSINNLSVLRNPLIESPSETDIKSDVEGMYAISFNATLGSNLYKQLTVSMDSKDKNELSPIKFKLSLKSRSSLSEFITDCTVIEKDDISQTIKLRAVLMTNNNINVYDKLCITDTSILPVPIPLVYESFYYIDFEIDVKILCVFRSEDTHKYRNTLYDKYLSEKEKDNFYYIPTIYNVSEVKLVEDFTDNFNLSMDVKLNDTVYQTYDTDIYETYDETIYEVDSKGDIVYEKKKIINDIGTETVIDVPKIIHRKGELKLDSNNQKVIKYKKGSIVYNDNGVPVVKNANSYYAIIKPVPWFDRLFNVNTKYFEIKNAYTKMIDSHNAISQTIIDGVSLTLGLKKTSGVSSLYEVYMPRTETYVQLDNLALSLKFGVSLDKTLSKTDKDYTLNNIVEKTKEYIYSYSGDVFSISELFRTLKVAIPSINYCEHYSINNYDSSVQSIHKNTTSSTNKDEILCIKMDIDDENSDFTNENIVFKPAIDITLI